MDCGKKRVLGIVGSPRRKGNTHLLVSRILEGARNEGATTSLIFIDRPPVAECDGCHACWKGNPCPKDDRGNEIFALMEKSDVIVFGTPVYWYGPTALMKALVDRLVFSTARRTV